MLAAVIVYDIAQAVHLKNISLAVGDLLTFHIEVLA